MLICGLTGTTGSGKGYVCDLLGRSDFEIIDTDKVYHDMISHKSECTLALISEFGDRIINSDGSVNRKELGKIVFSSKEKLERLNKITHRLILDKTRTVIENSDKKIAIIDAPQLFESGFDKECDLIICVCASRQQRIDRIKKRDNIDDEKALARINSQLPDEYLMSKSDYILINDDDSNIEAQTENLKKKLLLLSEENKQ